MLKSNTVQAHHSYYAVKYAKLAHNKRFFKFGKHEVDGSQTFWFQGPFKLLKTIKDPKSLYIHG